MIVATTYFMTLQLCVWYIEAILRKPVEITSGRQRQKKEKEEGGGEGKRRRQVGEVLFSPFAPNKSLRLLMRLDCMSDKIIIMIERHNLFGRKCDCDSNLTRRTRSRCLECSSLITLKRILISNLKDQLKLYYKYIEYQNIIIHRGERVSS